MTRAITTSDGDLTDFGSLLRIARVSRQFSQSTLALRTRIDQTRISDMEKGKALPNLPQLIRLCRALGVSIQWFLTGENTPKRDLKGIATELRHLGVVDLVLPRESVPGAFRPAEEVMSLAVAGELPDPRIIEAMPVVLSWNEWDDRLLRIWARKVDSRSPRRLGWLADVALTIHRTSGFPGGCGNVKSLERLASRRQHLLGKTPKDDDLGRSWNSSTQPPLVSKRWRIGYDASLSSFQERAQSLWDQSPRHHLGKGG